MNQRIERDGWYIDFSYGLQCDINREQMMGGQYAPGGCRDRYQFKQVGTGRDGYPLIETTTMYGPDGQAMFTSTKEVVELSREPLDAALFDVPAGYTETKTRRSCTCLQWVPRWTKPRAAVSRSRTRMPATQQLKRGAGSDSGRRGSA